jgi:predicted RNA polymerase sigma factor
LEIVDPLVGHPSLNRYPYLPGVRADLLFKLKRFAEAKAEFEKAAALTNNLSQRALLLEKAAACTPV